MEKLHVEEHQWWLDTRLRGMSQKAKNALLAELKEKRPDLAEEHQRDVEAAAAARRIIAAGPTTGCEAHIDYSQPSHGETGSSLQRVAALASCCPGMFSGASNADWRKRVLSEAP